MDPQGFTVKRPGHAVDNEPRGVFGHCRGLAPSLHVGHCVFHEVGMGLQCGDDFHQCHQRGWIEKVQSQHPVGVVTCLCQGRDGKGRGVGGQNSLLREDGFKRLEQLTLGLQLLHNGFNHEVAPLHIHQVGCSSDSPLGCSGLFSCPAAFLHQSIHDAGQLIFASFQGLVLGIHKDDLTSRFRSDLCHPTSHGPCTNNAYCFPLVHAAKVIPSANVH